MTVTYRGDSSVFSGIAAGAPVEATDPNDILSKLQSIAIDLMANKAVDPGVYTVLRKAMDEIRFLRMLNQWQGEAV